MPKILPNSQCPICGVNLHPFNLPKDEEGKDWVDSAGCYWCKTCATEFDSIDWDAVTNERLKGEHK